MKTQDRPAERARRRPSAATAGPFAPCQTKDAAILELMLRLSTLPDAYVVGLVGHLLEVLDERHHPQPLRIAREPLLSQ